MPDHNLGAIVLILRAKQTLEIRQHMGRASQQLALRIIQQRSPALSEIVHDSNVLKPFTTTGLFYEDSVRPVRGIVQVGDLMWLRMTGLNSQIVEALNQYARQPPAEEEYDNRRWILERVVCATVHQWTGHTNYADLLDDAQSGDPIKKITLRFTTPTTFHSKGLDVPLPIPTLIFRSLIERWNAFAPEPLPYNLLTFVEQFIAVTQYQTKTVMLDGKQGSRHSGFVGEVMFTVKADNPGLRAHDPDLTSVLKKDHVQFSALISMLARYAFFSGVGRQTTTGMGMCSIPMRTEA
jgi:CRISPR-associated endoribonuclease Cas6